jgi:hypothetical protein
MFIAMRIWSPTYLLPRGGGSVMKPTFWMPARWQANTTLPTNS